jgi:hypothetical protein
MPARPSKSGHKYRATIEIKGPQQVAAFTSFKKALRAALKKVNGKVVSQKKSGRAQGDT